MAGRDAKKSQKSKAKKEPSRPDRSSKTGRAAAVPERSQAFMEPSSGNATAQGGASKQTQGYGTAQGASGATSGGADAGGSLHVASPDQDA